ncbi:MAG: protein-ADP-ribose hydrolase [Anaerovoracaceae bacterium]|jgi:O-acetyl-ADP-ribose deacetylase (regulator of RNase III)
MNQRERAARLIQYLEDEMPEYAGEGVPENEQDAFNLFRALCNVRMPGPAPQEFLCIQDAYLQEETAKKGITDADDLRPVSSDERMVLWQGDITTLKCDAIVNAANSQMLGCFRPLHNCIDNIENTYAGVQLRNYMNEQMEQLKRRYGEEYEQPTAVPMISPAFNLPSKHIVHVVGPIVSPFLTREHKEQLAECYRASLDLAAENGCANIAFCCISTGVFMFPQDKAAEIAVRTVRAWLDAHADNCMKKVIFNVFKDSDREIYGKLLG